MYSNIPKQETINIITEYLTQLDIDDDTITQTIKLLQCVLDQNYFQYNTEIYLQKEGLPMESPLSPLLADIFIQHLEQN